MSKDKAILTFVVTLGVLLVLLGCERKEIPMKTIRRVLYYENEHRFVGTTTKLPDITVSDIRESYNLNLVRSTIVWDVKGQHREVHMSVPVFYATLCRKLNKIVALSILGVFVLPVDGDSPQWLLKEDDLTFFSIQAVNFGAERILLLAHETVSNQLLLIGLDVRTGRATKFEIPEISFGMEFINANTAVASIGEDLIWVRFLEKGDIKFSVQEGGAQKGAVWGVYNGEIIFYSVEGPEGKGTLLFDEITVPFDQGPRYLVSSEFCIWVITPGNKIFKIRSDGSKSLILIETIENIIGAGAFNGGLWIATDDGYVMTFGKTREKIKISLP